MQRILLVCNLVLALLLAIRLAETGRPVLAGARAPSWSADDVRVLPVVVERDGSRQVREVLVDLGAEVGPEAPAADAVAGLDLRLDPVGPVPGFWASPRSVRLCAPDWLLPARRYRVVVGRALVASDGRELPAGLVLEFATPGVRLGQVLVDEPESGAVSTQLTASFDLPIGLEQARKALRVVDADDRDRALPCEVLPLPSLGDGEAFALRLLDAEPPPAVDVIAAAGLVPLGGEVPTEQEQVRRAVLNEPLTLDAVVAVEGGIDLQLNRTVALPDAGLVRVEPAAPFQLRRTNGGLRILGGFPAGSVVTVELAPGFPGTGRARLPRATRRSLLLPDRAPALDFAQAGTVLCASALPRLLVRGCNVARAFVRLRAVYANNLVRALQDGDDRVLAPAPAQELQVAAARNAEWTQEVDLQALHGGPVRGLFQVELWDGDRPWRCARRLLQFSDLGLTVRAGRLGAAVHVHDLARGGPVAAAEVTIVTPTNQTLAVATTDAHGIARLGWPAGAADREPFLVLARTPGDAAFVDLRQHAVELADEGLGGRPWLREDGVEAFVWPTRGIARPGETVDLAVLLRDAAGAAAPGQQLEVRFSAPAGPVVRRQRVTTPGSGLCAASIALGADAPTGRWTARVWRKDTTGETVVGSSSFQVEAFVPNRLEAEVVALSPLRFGSIGSVRVRANWLDGAPAAGRPVAARVRLLPHAFSPAGAEGFAFASGADAPPPGELPAVEALLDGRGEAELRLPMPADAPQQTLLAQVAIEVLDPSGRAVRTSAQAPLLRQEMQLGVRARGGRVELRVVDAEGARVAGSVPATVRLERRVWDWRHEQAGQGRWRWRTFVQKTTIGEWSVALQDGVAAIDLPPAADGGWLAVVATAASLTTEQDLDRAPERPDRLRVRSPAGPVAPGDTAHVTVTAPDAGAGFVTLETDRVLAAFPAQLERGDNDVAVPVPAALRVPNVHVVVTLTRPVTASGPGQGPPWLVGGACLPLRSDDVALQVALTVPAKVLPEQPLRCAIAAPGATAALVAVVDEGVLDVTGHRDPDPLAFCRAARALATDGADSGPALLQAMAFAPGTKSGGDGDEGGLGGQLAGSTNTRIRPLALCMLVGLDADGRGLAEFTLPPYEGRVRAMVVAAGPARLGGGSAATVVQAPLGLQVATPRMVSPGDRFTVPVTLANATPDGGVAVLELAAQAGLALGGPARLEVPLAAGAIASVDVPLVAGATGEPVLTISASLGGVRRRVEAAIPVRVPAVVVREDHGIDLATGSELRVGDDWQQVEGLLRVDATPDRQLEPVLERLLQYPYGCAEQTTSKGLGLLACHALLPRLWEADAPRLREVPVLLQTAVDRLFAMQTARGGFGWWQAARADDAFVTVHALDFLLGARDAGLDVPERALALAVDRLAALAAGDGERSLRCHAIEVLARAGRPVQPVLDWLCTQAATPEDRARLATALARSGERDRARALLADDVELPPVRESGGCLASPLRARALLFRARSAIDAADPELPVLARALQRAVLADARATTQENAQCLRALAEYWRGQPLEAAAPRLSGTIDGRPLPAGGGAQRLDLRPGSVLRIDAGGAGFALLTLTGLRTPAPGPLRGRLQLERRLVDIDTGAEVTSCRRGRIYELQLRGTIDGDVGHLVLVDLLPGGLEPEPPAPGSAPAPAGDVLAADQIERRDDRVLLFHAGTLPRQFEFRHRVRAVFPGDWAVPALCGEAMYDPSVACTVASAARLEIRP